MNFFKRWGLDPITAQTLVTSLGLQLIILISGVISARMLGVLDRGNLALFWTISLVVTQIAALGLPQAVTFEIARNGWSAMTIYSTLRTRIMILTALALVTQSLIVAVVFGDDSEVILAACLSLVSVPALVIYSFAVAALQGEERFGQMNFARLLPFGAYSLLLIAGVIAGLDSLLFVTCAWVGTLLVASVWSTGLVFAGPPSDRLEPKGSPNPGAMTRFGIKGLLGATPPTETFRPDQLVVGLALAPASLGLYVAALSLTNLPRFLALSVGLVAYPRIAALEDKTGLEREIWKYTGLGALVAVAAAAPLFVLAEPLLGLFFGDEFTSAASTVQIILLGSPFLAARRVMADGLRGADHPGAGTVAELVAWFWLIPTLAAGSIFGGLEGVAGALSSSFLVSFLATIYLLRKYQLGRSVAS